MKMRFLPSLALAALLGTSVLGSILKIPAASCDLQEISPEAKVSDGSFLAKLTSATHQACTEWSKTNELNGTFDSVPFKLSHSSTVELAKAESCISALELIIENCRTNNLYFGGSTVNQDVHYTIGRAESELVTTLEARAKGSKQKPDPKKGSGAKKAGAKSPAAKSPAAKSPAAKSPAAKSPAAKSPAAKSPAASPISTGPACKAKNANSPADKGSKASNGNKASGSKSKQSKTSNGNKASGSKSKQSKTKTGKLSGRAILLDAIRNFSRSLQKRTSKSAKVFDRNLASDNYPSSGKLVENPKTLYFGFRKKDLQWFADEYGKVDKNDLEPADSEHIVEWQNVAGFFVRRGEKDQNIKEELNKLLDPQSAPKFTIVAEKYDGNGENEEIEGTFSEIIAAAYPSTTRWTDELVLFQKRPNENIKMNMFSDIKIIDNNFPKDDPEKAILWIRDGLGVGYYHLADKIREIYKTQTTRMGKQIKKLGDELSCKHKNFNPKDDDLEKEWTSYMNDTWKKAMTRLTEWMQGKIELMDKELKCGLDSKAAENDTAEDETKQCKDLRRINEEWKNIEKNPDFGTPPWGGLDAGTKRPATPKTSDNPPKKKESSGPPSSNLRSGGGSRGN